MNLKQILSKYSNPAIAAATGYPSETIHMLRKGEVDEHTIKQLPGGRALPTRKVLEQKILDAHKSGKFSRNKKFFN